MFSLLARLIDRACFLPSPAPPSPHTIKFSTFQHRAAYYSEEIGLELHGDFLSKLLLGQHKFSLSHRIHT